MTYKPATREETLKNLKEKVELGWKSIRIDSKRQRWAIESVGIALKEGWVDTGEFHDFPEQQYSYYSYGLNHDAIREAR